MQSYDVEPVTVLWNPMSFGVHELVVNIVALHVINHLQNRSEYFATLHDQQTIHILEYECFGTLLFQIIDDPHVDLTSTVFKAFLDTRCTEWLARKSNNIKITCWGVVVIPG